MFDKRVPKEYYEEMDGGRMEELFYDSRVYSGDQAAVRKRALVYLPKGYEENDRRYKVLYLMHGGGGDEEEIMYCQDRSLALKHLLDHMIANGDIEPLMVVTPTFYYADSDAALHDITEAVVLTKNFHYEFRNDLLPAVDGTYRTIPDREHRAFGGFSMGAEATWEMFLNSLDLIRNFMPLSGDCWIAAEKGGASFSGKTSRLMKAAIKERGFDGYSYNIFAFTGNEDIAFPAMDPMIKAMLADGFDDGEDRRLRYGTWKEGIHTYHFGYEYIYNILPEILR
ncbi:MAG: hypothetical protein K6E30_09570 [Lachnospiraceae bacterium]|nr:hypothetical protein [Lachnospiraceae bacterium]